MMTAIEIVNEQAEDDGCWFIAETITEAYLQQELRRLHEAVEREYKLTDAGKRK
jgi:hypothetical protein